MKVLDLFSGIGGFSLGLECAGWETIAFCEIEPSCNKILSKYWPDIPIFDDITKLSANDIESSVDIICGGFPCQDISIAGKKAGIGGLRSALWKQYLRLINEIRPKYAIIENVANLRSNGLITVLQDLWQIGYNAEWHCIPASAIGAPHQRDRIWIVANPDNKGCNNNQGKTTRKNDKKRRQECSANSITGRNIIAKEKLSLYETGFTKETTGAKLQNSKTILANPDCEGLQRYRQAGGFSQILKEEKISLFRCSRGVEQWEVEPDIARLKDGKLNADWVEWLMGFPVGWTEGLTRKQRLIALGNALVPIIPEMIGVCIQNYENSKL